MPYELVLPAPFSAQWRVKIRDKERLEPPHVTIIRGTDSWRLGLRDGRFMDPQPPEREVPRALLAHVELNWELLKSAWNEMYPMNPV